MAVLFNVRPETINKRIRDIRQLLPGAHHTIQPTSQPTSQHLTTLEDLYNFARTAGITIPHRAIPAS